jgi:hypothetical protein
VLYANGEHLPAIGKINFSLKLSLSIVDRDVTVLAITHRRSVLGDTDNVVDLGDPGRSWTAMIEPSDQ